MSGKIKNAERNQNHDRPGRVPNHILETVV